MKVIQEGNKREQVRMEVLALPMANTWVSVFPNPAFGYYMGSLEFILAMRFLMGLRIYKEGTKCEPCDLVMDVYGDHAMHCRHGPERILRHNSVRDVFCQTAQAAGLNPRKEARKLLEDGESRPADVLIPGWTNRTAIRGAEMEKRRKHGEKCRAQGLTFKPLACHNMGGWSADAVEDIRKVAGALARAQGEEDRDIVSQHSGDSCETKGEN